MTDVEQELNERKLVARTNEIMMNDEFPEIDKDKKGFREGDDNFMVVVAVALKAVDKAIRVSRKCMEVKDLDECIKFEEKLESLHKVLLKEIAQDKEQGKRIMKVEDSEKTSIAIKCISNAFNAKSVMDGLKAEFYSAMAQEIQKRVKAVRDEAQKKEEVAETINIEIAPKE